MVAVSMVSPVIALSTLITLDRLVYDIIEAKLDFLALILS